MKSFNPNPATRLLHHFPFACGSFPYLCIYVLQGDIVISKRRFQFVYDATVYIAQETISSLCKSF